jgi:type II secretory pathway pseudopilin PulG
MLAAFQQAVDAAFDAYGETVTYTPSGGAAAEIPAIPRQADQRTDWSGPTTVHTAATVFDVRASDIAHPAAGDTIDHDGQTYTVQGEPRRDDPRRLVWTLDTRPA